MATHFFIRDYAARNILIGADLLVKISDFGLGRALETAIYCQIQVCFIEFSCFAQEMQGGALPLRWLAPEAVQNSLKFSARNIQGNVAQVCSRQQAMFGRTVCCSTRSSALGSCHTAIRAMLRL